jgi:hypothetical protein
LLATIGIIPFIDAQGMLRATQHQLAKDIQDLVITIKLYSSKVSRAAAALACTAAAAAAALSIAGSLHHQGDAVALHVQA